MKIKLLFLIFLTGSTLAQQSTGMDFKIPIEVSHVLNDALNGKIKSIFNHFDHYKIKMGFPTTAKLTDIKIGFPVNVFDIPDSSLSRIDENIPISILLKKYGINYSKNSGHYEVPLLLNDSVIVNIKIWEADSTAPNKTQWHVAGWGGGGAFEQRWQKVIQKWPRNKGFNPILILIHGKKHGIGYIYIPEKGDYNLTRYRSIDYPVNLKEDFKDSLYYKLSDSRTTLLDLKDSIQSWNTGATK